MIVPVYKVEKYLRKCVDSILAQTFTDFEVILVDDGSPDNSGKICDEYAEKDNRVRVIHKENGGLSSARNAGIDVARGKYLGFVDSDDYIDEDMYEILYENLKIHDADISSVELIPFYGDRYK
ncbi:glycosyl transferase family 2, partial [Enterococcus faecium]